MPSGVKNNIHGGCLCFLLLHLNAYSFWFFFFKESLKSLVQLSLLYLLKTGILLHHQKSLKKPKGAKLCSSLGLASIPKNACLDSNLPKASAEIYGIYHDHHAKGKCVAAPSD